MPKRWSAGEAEPRRRIEEAPRPARWLPATELVRRALEAEDLLVERRRVVAQDFQHARDGSPVAEEAALIEGHRAAQYLLRVLGDQARLT